MTAATASSGEVLVPPERCYWQVLDLSPGERPSGTRLLFRVERVLPCSIDACQVDLVRLAGGRILAAAMPHAAIGTLSEAGAVTAGTWRLAPSALPAEVLAAGVPAEALLRINLLRGRHEPARTRRGRRILAALAGITVLVVVGSLILGTQRRVAILRAEAAGVAAQAESLAATVLPPATGAQVGQPATVRLVQDWRRLTTADRGGVDPGAEVVGIAEALFRQWPDRVRLQIEQLSITPERIDLRGYAADATVAERLATAIATVRSGDRIWTAAPLSVQQVDGATRFALVLMPVAGAVAGDGLSGGR
jgi:hypothetical protein